jgi:hypothetical protein
MPHILVTAETSDGRQVVLLAERVPPVVVESKQGADQLQERIVWAIDDADGIERASTDPARSRPPPPA